MNVTPETSTVEFDRTPLEPFFFEELFGVWRAPYEKPRRVWVFCPPFAEEDKSARRTLVALCDELVSGGDATLLFSLRGTGDSKGNFAGATVEQWLQDVRLACIEARRRAPEAALCLCGLRLGAALAFAVADEISATRCILIEPQNGKDVLQELRQKKRLRAMMTKQENDQAQNEQAANEQAANEQALTALAEDDFDGWPISASLHDSLETLNNAPQPGIPTLLVAVNPRGEATARQNDWAREAKAETTGVKMPAFWNRLDTVDAAPLLQTISRW